MTFLLLFQLAVYVAVIIDQCGSVSLNCISTKPKDQETLSCTCANPTNGIEWRKGTTGITSCSGATDNCFPATSGFTSNVSIDEFYMQISPYSHTDCATYSCKDATTGDEKSITVSIAAFDKSTITTTEPGAKTDGSISVTTDCMFSPSDLEIKWYKLQGSAQRDFADPVLSNDRSTCTRTCNSLEDKKVTSGFTHTEYHGSNAVEVKFMVTVSHSSYSEKFTWTSDFYMIEGEPDPDCFDITIRVVCIIIICVVGLGMKIVVIVCYIIKKIKEKKTFLILEVAVIVLFIICCGIGISVLTDKDIDHCPWQKKCAQAFKGIAVSLVIVDVIIMVLVYFGKIKPFKKGITKQDLRPWEEIVREKLLHVLESAYPKILSVKDLIRKVDAEESVVNEQLEELRREDLIRQLDSGGFVRHLLDVKTRITKQDLRPWEEIVREMLLHVLESVYPNILSVTVKDLIRIDFAEESVVMEQLEELRRKDLIRQLDSGGFVRHRLDVKTGGMNGGRGHGGGRGPNSNTVHSGREDKHRGTLSDRANSDGEVSRKDVHVQENRDNFSGRPMPPIPLTDKKGRGLSANYDDDHPMISVATPDRRAGDLGPLDEKPRKKKKKKKKAVNDNDE